jgi:hypothetical protein
MCAGRVVKGKTKGPPVPGGPMSGVLRTRTQAANSIGKRPRGSPRSCIAMPNVSDTIIVFLETLQVLVYRPGCRGGRRDMGALRPNCGLEPPALAFCFGALAND